jgi:hypothetical protein
MFSDMEMLEGRWWILAGVGLVALAKTARPVAKGAIKGYLAARDGLNRMTAQSRAGLRSLYDEAQAEYRSAATKAAEDAAAADRTTRMESGGVLLPPPAAGPA